MISSKSVLIATFALGTIVMAGPGSHHSGHGSSIGGVLLEGAAKGAKHWLKHQNQDSQQPQFQQMGDSQQGYPQPGQQQFPRGDPLDAALVRRGGGGAVSEVIAKEGEGLAKEGVEAVFNTVQRKHRKKKAKAQAQAQQDQGNAPGPVNSRDYEDIIELLERALDDDIFERDYDDDFFERDDDDLLEREDDDEPFARDDDDLLERDEELEEFFGRDNGLFDELD